MARIISIGPARQEIYLIDRDDFAASTIGSTSIFGKIEIGSQVNIDKITYAIGGSGTNSAVTFARCGHESIFVGTIGRDSAGEAILATLDNEGIDTSFISSTQKSTACSVALLDAKTSHKTTLVYHGAHTQFDKIKPSLITTIDPDWLYISSINGDMDTILSLVNTAKSQKCHIMFAPSTLELDHPTQLLSLLPEIDILLLNKKEASSLVPGQILSELASHLQNYTPSVIITDGAMGGFAINPDHSYRFGIYEDIKVKDTSGAGDAFGSGFLSALASGKSFKQSLIFASANATSVVKHIGAQKGILTGREKLHEMPIR